MHYRSVADLSQAIVEQVPRLPSDIDLVVGVPRSGMLAAGLIALHANLSLADLDGFLTGRVMESGIHRSGIGPKRASVEDFRRALIVDDSLLTGTEMKRARARITEAGLADKCLFSAVYCKPGEEQQLDFVFEPCETPRVFEWNLMHGHLLPKSCVDIDGVLCVDPTEAENDDGPRYRDFLAHATPLWKPSARIDTLVTSRLEKYRALTESWLAEQGVEFDRLVMMPYETMQERQEARAYAQFKAHEYARGPNLLFIESSPLLSPRIAKLAGKPVLCIENHALYEPSGLPHARERLKVVASQPGMLFRRACGKLKRLLT